MRILLGHTFYRSEAPSGEDTVYRNERGLLERAGHEVIPFERHNDDIGDAFAPRAKTAAEAIWSKRTEHEITTLIERERPDVAHFHNTFPLISPSAYAACRRLGVPVVQTLHNYRLICPGALLMRNGAPCEECVGGSLLPALRHGCYRQSRLATATVVAMLEANRLWGSYRTQVDRFIALTEFARQKFVRGGLPARRIVVRPNFLLEERESGGGLGGYALYVGRLSREKGVRTLVEAWDRIDALPLKIVGDGPLMRELKEHVARVGSAVEFVGFASANAVGSFMRDAVVQIVPSEWYEGFPMVVVEAFAAGTPLLVSRIGALDAIVSGDSGGKFTPGSSESLAHELGQMLSDPARIERARVFNRRLFEQHYSRSQALTSLLDVYESAIRPSSMAC